MAWTFAGMVNAAPPPPTLLDLARLEFKDLTAAEVKLFEKTQRGEEASSLSGDPKEDHPAHAPAWKDDRVIHGERLRWLCADPKAAAFVTRRGVQLVGMRIDGDLDLQGEEVKFPLSAEKCFFSGQIVLVDAQLPTLFLSGSSINDLDADGVQVRSNVFLRDSSDHVHFTSRGEIRFIGASIGGDFDCRGARLYNPNGAAVEADRSEIKGNLCFDDGFQAEGAILLMGANIGGQIRFPGAYLSNPDGIALAADWAAIKGGVFLNNGFNAVGSVQLPGTNIGGNLDCTGAQFRNLKSKDPRYPALDANGATIGGDIFLTTSTDGKKTPFKAEGEVRLVGLTLGKGLDLRGAHLFNPDGDALWADGASIKGSVVLRNQSKSDSRTSFNAQGEIRFAANIGGHFDCRGAHLSNPNGDALSAEGADIKGWFLLGYGFVAQGRVTLIGASIGGSLDCSGGEFSCSPSAGSAPCAIQAGVTKIVGNVFLRASSDDKHPFKSSGGIWMLGANIGGTLQLTGAQISNPNKSDLKFRALDLEGAKIAGNVLLHPDEGIPLEVEGRLDFHIAEVDHQLEIWGLTEPEKTSLDLRSATVGILCDERKSWPPPGNLFLAGFVYKQIHDQATFKAEDRIDWIHRQSQDRFLPQTYEQLAGVFHEMGMEEDSRKVLIQMNSDHGDLLARFPSQDWWWYQVFGKFIGYGYRPDRPFLLSLGFILLGWFLFHRGFVSALICPSGSPAYEPVPAGTRAVSTSYPRFNAAIYSLESFVPLVKFDQGANWAPNANLGRPWPCRQSPITTGGLLRLYLYGHTLAGWVLTTLWVGAVTGLVKS